MALSNANIHFVCVKGSSFNSLRWAVLLIWLTSLALVISACSDLSGFKNSNLVDDSFTTGLPCEAPCWQGLELNESTTDQVYAKLRELPFVDPNSIKTWEHVTAFGFSDATTIHYDCFGYNGGGCGYLLLANGVLKVSNHLILYKLLLKNVVRNFGPPDHVIFNPYSAHQEGCVLDFEWPQKNVLISSYNFPNPQWCLNLQDGKALDPEIYVTQISYMVPEAFLLNYCRESNCVSWPGFKP